MNKWLAIPEDRKIKAYTQIAENTGMASHAVEKDWWVVQVLSTIFEMESGNHLVFKGGTSLSKAWGLINRFSEDVDLAIDRSFLGFEGELRKKEITALRKKANLFITESFFPELQQKMFDKGFENLRWEILDSKESDQDPKIIMMYYTNAIESPGYLQPKVQIEIGCRSLREPFKTQKINAMVDEHYPDADFAMPYIEVPTVIPERTFLEKIFLLHEEFSKPAQNIRVQRLSRHLYDVYQLSKTTIALNALADKKLYETIVNHRHQFTRVSGVDYNLHQPQTLNPIPPDAIIKAWEADYNTMLTEMIYGDAPSFNVLMKRLIDLKAEINGLNWKMESVFSFTR